MADRRDGALLLNGIPAIIGDCCSALLPTPRNAARGLFVLVDFDLLSEEVFQGSSDTLRKGLLLDSDDVTSASFTGTAVACADGGGSLNIPSKKFDTLKLLPPPNRAWTSGVCCSSLLFDSAVIDGSRVGGVKNCGRNSGTETERPLSLPDLGECSSDGSWNKDEISCVLLSPLPIIDIKSLFRGGDWIDSIPEILLGLGWTSGEERADDTL